MMNDAPSPMVIPRWDRRAVVGIALLWGAALLLIADRWFSQWWPAWFAAPRFGYWTVLAVAGIAMVAGLVFVIAAWRARHRWFAGR